eukprot:134224-Amphidinium_carterae.2
MSQPLSVKDGWRCWLPRREQRQPQGHALAPHDLAICSISRPETLKPCLVEVLKLSLPVADGTGANNVLAFSRIGPPFPSHSPPSYSV